MSGELTEREALKALTAFLIVEKARVPRGPYGTLQLRFDLGEGYSYTGMVANNSYSEAALGSLGGLLDAARAALAAHEDKL